MPPQSIYHYLPHSEQTHYDPSTSQYYSSQGHHPLQSPYTSPPMSRSLKIPPQVHPHEFPEANPHGNDFQWTPLPPVRSLSVADTQDLHNMYPAYRSNTFPSIPHRLSGSGEVSHMPHAYPSTVDSNSHQDSFSHHYAPSTHQQMNSVSTVAWSSTIPTHSTNMPISSSDTYHPNWYPTPTSLPYLREEDDPLHSISSQESSHPRFWPNPG